MRVVDTEHASAGRVVQRQRVADALRTVRVRRNTPSHDLDPEAAADLGDESVEIDEPVEAFVAAAHPDNISDNDNKPRCLQKKRSNLARTSFAAAVMSQNSGKATSRS